MFSTPHPARFLVFALVATMIAGAGLAPEAHAQGDPAVTLRVVSKVFEFPEDTTLTVEVEIEGDVALAGLDFVISYPEELAPAVAEAQHASDLWSTVVVNYDRDDAQYSPPAGRRYASAAAASATNVGSTTGQVVALEFPVACAGNDPSVPDGNDVVFSIVAANAVRVVPDQDNDGFEDFESVPLTLVDGTITLKCTTVDNDDASFGTVKAFFGASKEVR